MRERRNRALSRAGRCALLVIWLFGLAACEGRAFRRAEAKNTIEAYQDYLKRYPEGKHEKAAQGHISQLEYDQATKQRSVEAYKAFIRKYPYSAVTPQATRALSMLVEVQVKQFTDQEIAEMRAVIKTDFGDITLKLRPDKAPNTCRNFIKLAWSLFYDQTRFNLIVPGVLVQGGAPGDDPNGGPGYIIQAEFNDLPNVTGAVGMVRWENPDSAGSQFYITLRRLPERDGKYTVFAEVEKGIEIVEVISDQENTGPQGRPQPFEPTRPIFIRGIDIVRPNEEPEGKHGSEGGRFTAGAQVGRHHAGGG